MSDFETLLQDRLATVREPEAVVPVGLAAGLRRRHRRQQRLTLAGLSTTGLFALGGLVFLGSFGSEGRDSAVQVSSTPETANTPVPGITPAFTPRSGRDWLPSREEFERFRAAHPVASLGPEQPGTTAERLLAEVQHAGLPAGAQVRITGRDLPSVQIRLASGVPIDVVRYQRLYPTALNPDGAVAGATYELIDVPGTSAAAVLRSRTGYGWPLGTVGDRDANHDGDSQNDSPSVLLATSRGLTTFWVAPPAASLDALRQLAFAADHWAAEHPVQQP